MNFIIEHLEKKLYEWCMIEYEHISKIVGKKNLIFTNTREKKLKKFGNVEPKSVTKLKLRNACLLDPKAKKTLISEEAKNFDYFIFGGILGDYPEQGRTEKYLTSKMNVETRNLGSKQMSTDTAVIVTKMIIRGKRLNDIKFMDEPIIILKKGKIHEEINLPYRYVENNNKPIISNKLIRYLKRKQDL
ncbi:MAG TPA: SAM-dependent methyltransferase [Candidatus Nanoarchaeia archaeon]|nr:SAM-dependent methyltransferase [Candidatus Nanoarchaeia archaeon]